MMTLKNYSNMNFFNTPPLFDGERFDVRKTRKEMFLEAIDFDLWNFVINGPFTHTYIVINSEK